MVYIMKLLITSDFHDVKEKNLVSLPFLLPILIA